MMRTTFFSLGIILLFFSWTQYPQRATMQFAEGTTFAAIAALIDAPNELSAQLRSANGTLFYFDPNKSIADQEAYYWRMHDGLVTIMRNETWAHRGCWERNDCPILTVAQLQMVNPPAALQSAAFIESVVVEPANLSDLSHRFF